MSKGRALIRVGNYDIPTPSTYLGNTADIVDSGRNVEGRVIGSVIRHDVGKVEASWRYLTVKEWSDILKRFNPKYGGSFYNKVTFFNQVTATWETRTMYVGDRTTGGLIQLDKNGNPQGYVQCKLALVEV